MASKNINIDTKALNEIAKNLKGFEKEIPGAIYSSVNRTLDYAVTQTVKEVTKKYAIKSKEVRATLKKVVARKGEITARIESRGHTLSFAHFPFTPKKPKKVKNSIFENAVMVTIKKSKGKTLSKKGFVATTGAKSEDKIQFNVFKRLGKERLPIAPIRTLSIPQMITNDKVSETVTEATQKKLLERINHEVKYRLDKIDKK